MEYRSTWDLSTIPTEVWNGENGRRVRMKAPAATNIKLKPCLKCSRPLTATERRKPCPGCGFTHPRKPSK